MSVAPLTSASPASLGAQAGGAKTGPADPSCRRHQELRGTRACRRCGAPLCTACHGHAHHRECPDCLMQQGRPPWVVDGNWWSALLVDAVRTAAPRLHHSALPLLAIAWTALTQPALLFGTVGLRSVPLLPTLGDVALTAVLIGSLGTAFRQVPSTWTRVTRAVAAFMIGTLAYPVLVTGLAAGVYLTGERLNMGWLVMVVVAIVPWVVLGSVGGVMQAAAGLLPWPFFRALALPFTAGFRAWAAVAFTSVFVMVPSFAVETLLDASGPVDALVRVLVHCGSWFLQACVALAGLRYLLDARAVRQ